MKEISKAKYQGYLWKSDEEFPEVLYGNEEKGWLLDETKNPFIIEGRLWDSANKRSISINYIDGSYQIADYDVNDKELADKSQRELYIPHKIEKTGKLVFLRRWQCEKDKLCEGFEILIPGDLIFVGFEKKEEEK